MRRTKAEAEETRNSILNAAERVFFEKGVSTASLDDVAKAAGVTRGAIYWHFSNKTDLFLELYNTVNLPLEDMIARNVVQPGADVLCYIEKSAGDWLDQLAGDEHRQRIFTILLRCPYGEDLLPVLEKQQEVDDRHTVMLDSAFDTARSEGFLNGNWTPQSATKALRWMMEGLCSEWLLFGRRFDLASEGKDGLKRLFDSFRQTPATAEALAAS
ncbi:TetR family transcriptional regulator [Rhizobium sp. LjRoot98]|uniref:TetR family transcriptional regulator n=1 Tax=unclassified Rhizobium TaxID=2613769 RepID=UPI0007148B49|nr:MULTISPECIES: TetR family transcriptional regulator [unclassified Rhizobium]KQV39274.1 TetR family transcriptional regulator [Rhizobium sp. Root1204]KQY18344.1 TetR family transcriptional regulator [Rhizobium sp. Root1334]KRB98642.1 TetR family transcriptional regulator [Rhizobium sp. Root73]